MLLDTVYKEAASGVAWVGAALRLVLAEGHKVLYKQLLAWLLQGSLYNPHDEFLIVVDEGAEESLLLGEDGVNLNSAPKAGSLSPLLTAESRCSSRNCTSSALVQLSQTRYGDSLLLLSSFSVSCGLFSCSCLERYGVIMAIRPSFTIGLSGVMSGEGR